MGARCCWLFFTAALAAGCDAKFTDLRDPSVIAADPRDANLQGGTIDGIIATGMFTDANGYLASGQVALAHLTSGATAIFFDTDFRSTEVPSPVVVLTTQSDVGPQIDESAGDMQVAVLANNTGTQIYELPSDPGTRRNVFVFCVGLGLTTAAATLSGG
jgi:hypothetical protein